MRTNDRSPLVVALLLVALPACQITWRQRPVEPLDRDRKYEMQYDQTWVAVQQVMRGFGLEVKEQRQEGDVGLVDTEFKVLSDTDEDVNRLNKVAYTGPGGFIGGRYAMTVTVRGLNSGETKVKVVTRVEGFINEEYGYQVLRSTGLLENEVFVRIGNQLGTEPIA